MARLATPDEVNALGRSNPLSFANVPKELRPSGWRYWAERVTEAQLREALAGGVDRSRAVEMAAGELQSEGYTRWLDDHDLLSDAGRPVRGWSSTALARWEEST